MRRSRYVPDCTISDQTAPPEADLVLPNGCMIEGNRMENGNQPATKQDLAEVRTEMENRMQAMEDRLIKAFRDSQTELLKAFYSFTESNRQRVSQVEGNQIALITRVGTLEDRLTDLERRLISPPRTQ